MHLQSLLVENFRCYQNYIHVAFNDITAFVGKNDSGKSTLLDALEIFFEGRSSPDRDDACIVGDAASVRIACEFSHLPTKIVLDRTATTTFKDEFLLNENGNLEIHKVFDCTKNKPTVTIFARSIHPSIVEYDDLLSLTNAKLRDRAKKLDVSLDSIDLRSNSSIRHAIWNSSTDLKLETQDIPLLKEDAKSLWENIKSRLPIYALFRSDRASTDQDSEAQDPMKAAIQAAIREQESQLESIADEVRKKVQAFAEKTVDKIKEMDSTLASQLKPHVATKKWDSLFSVSLTGDEDIPINKRGSGARRMVLLNFFRAKAEEDAISRDDVQMIYAIEEPETSQHPHNQRLLIDALCEISESHGNQVILTTHTPVLARLLDNKCLRFIDYVGSKNVRQIICPEEEKDLEKIATSLGVLPDHRVKAFWGVEGRHDINFLKIISSILHSEGCPVPDLKAEEENGSLVFVPLGGSNLDLWLSRLNGFNRHEFYLMDRDVPPPERPKADFYTRASNQKTNTSSWITNKREIENYLHIDAIKEIIPTYTGIGDSFENVPLLFAEAMHRASESSQAWEDITQNGEKLKKKGVPSQAAFEYRRGCQYDISTIEGSRPK